MRNAKKKTSELGFLFGIQGSLCGVNFTEMSAHEVLRYIAWNLSWFLLDYSTSLHCVCFQRMMEIAMLKTQLEQDDDEVWWWRDYIEFLVLYKNWQMSGFVCCLTSNQLLILVNVFSTLYSSTLQLIWGCHIFAVLVIFVFVLRKLLSCILLSKEHQSHSCILLWFSCSVSIGLVIRVRLAVWLLPQSHLSLCQSRCSSTL